MSNHLSNPKEPRKQKKMKPGILSFGTKPTKKGASGPRPLNSQQKAPSLPDNPNYKTPKFEQHPPPNQPNLQPQPNQASHSTFKSVNLSSNQPYLANNYRHSSSSSQNNTPSHRQSVSQQIKRTSSAQQSQKLMIPRKMKNGSSTLKTQLLSRLKLATSQNPKLKISSKSSALQFQNNSHISNHIRTPSSFIHTSNIFSKHQNRSMNLTGIKNGGIVNNESITENKTKDYIDDSFAGGPSSPNYYKSDFKVQGSPTQVVGGTSILRAQAPLNYHFPAKNNTILGSNGGTMPKANVHVNSGLVPCTPKSVFPSLDFQEASNISYSNTPNYRPTYLQMTTPEQSQFLRNHQFTTPTPNTNYPLNQRLCDSQRSLNIHIYSSSQKNPINNGRRRGKGRASINGVQQNRNISFDGYSSQSRPIDSELGYKVEKNLRYNNSFSSVQREKSPPFPFPSQNPPIKIAGNPIKRLSYQKRGSSSLHNQSNNQLIKNASHGILRQFGVEASPSVQNSRKKITISDNKHQYEQQQQYQYQRKDKNDNFDTTVNNSVQSFGSSMNQTRNGANISIQDDRRDIQEAQTPQQGHISHLESKDSDRRIFNKTMPRSGTFVKNPSPKFGKEARFSFALESQKVKNQQTYQPPKGANTDRVE